MEYVSIADLSNDIRENLRLLPRDVDLVVGLPRSGVLAATIVGLNLNTRVCDLPTFLANGEVKTGSTRAVQSSAIARAHEARTVLVVDDSVQSGAAIASAKAAIKSLAFGGDVKYCAVYAHPGNEYLVDIHVRPVSFPRFFEWNIFHRKEVASFCVDIDGVLCVDPTDEENDDGDRYRVFLLTAKSLIRPSYTIGHLVTSRLERYRRETEEWLRSQDIKFSHLHMLDLPSAAERRKLGVHGQFKAQVYRSLTDSPLFIESSSEQTRIIADQSGKPALDFGRQRMVLPNMGLPLVREISRKTFRRGVAGVRRRLGF